MDTDAVLTMLREVAAEVVTPRFRALAEGEVMEKNPGDLVTVADHEAEVILTRRLREAYPDAVVVGEEATSADPTLLQGLADVDHWFTVDPVDGTKNFVHGSPDHAVMVGEVRGGQPVRGWIWQPAHERAFVAERGAGAYADGRQIPDRTVGADGPLRGVTSRRRLVGTALPGLPPLELTWVCCGVDYPQLATGGADYVIYSGTMPWDHVPGTLLVSEVGGAARHLDGTPYRPHQTSGGLVASATTRVADRGGPPLQDQARVG